MIPITKRVISVALAAALSVTLFGGRASAMQYTGTDSYMTGKYYRRLNQVCLTGDPRTDIVAIARSQVGYQEGGSVNQLSGEVYGGVNHTEYGAWYGMQDMWCAMFVSWCANLAGISTDTVPSHCYTPDGLSWFASRGLAYTRAEVQSRKYTPKPGDLVYFKSSRNAKPTNHIGIVTGYENGRLYTVEGNVGAPGQLTNGGMVAALSYPISNTYIAYICSPNYGSGSTNVLADAPATQRKLHLESLREAVFALETGDKLKYDAVYIDSAGCLAIGCGQWYGAQATELLRQIRTENETAFAQLDPTGLLPDDVTLFRINDAQCRVLQSVLASEAGVQVQNAWMDRCLEDWMDRAKSLGVTDRESLLLCAALYQLRGCHQTELVIAKSGNDPDRNTLLNIIKNLEPGLYRTCRLLVE